MTVSELIEVLTTLREKHGDVEIWLNVCYTEVLGGEVGTDESDYEAHNAYASGPLMAGGIEDHVRFVYRNIHQRKEPAVELSALDM